MPNRDDYVEELQQLLDECVVALGSKTLRWDEIVIEIRKLYEENENRKLSVEHQISKRQLAEAENAKLREALEYYGRHDEENCPVGREHPRHVSEPCTCGLDDLLKGFE